ncbi:phosphatidic acid phosphatase beta [Drepanopeziza brunnea f. sp. 'multigermtubi' MB_m1]|uniref:Phosphatidic acid phosphatase beta n=1 Tax=Marssonina brunnea f. sp. multigermtubi (strain MB_m1) TaxID=1072389 RepID=K1Y870_MARBU|nr:phosphatidic acid phosphatase beta [Drepanopeziza brunnea f. sp. 'multigermtubi' MB_m1]EKD21354.1 phosphatidic acid phosphatase beta [Drepanopeziza brunnea f. sp. 'multigermtubi' MB_m1]
MPIVVASHTPRRRSEVVSRKDIGLSYLRIVWLEYLSIAVVATSALWAYSLPVYYLELRLIPIQRSSAPRSASEGSVPLFHGLVELSYPLVKEPLPTWACGLVVVLLPLLVITMFQLKLRSLWDFHAGFTGTLKTAAVSTLVATTLKHFIGGFRPHFLDVCKPDLNMILVQDFFIPQCVKLAQMPLAEREFSLYDYRIIADSGPRVQGFPSGHTTSAFASSIFLALYINAKLKAFGDHASEFWVFIATMTPLLLATLIAGPMYISYHHAYEIVISMLIGLMLGVLGYRSAYAAVFDYRYNNHIPFPPFGSRTRFTYTPDAQTIEVLGHNTDAEHLAMWDWWSKSEVTGQDQERGLSWLRNMGFLVETGEDTHMIVKLRLQKEAKVIRWTQ